MEATFQATQVTERGIHIPNIMCVVRETDGKIIVIGYLVELIFNVQLTSGSSSTTKIFVDVDRPGHHSGTSIQATINIILFAFDFIYTTIHVVNTSSIVTHIIPN